MTTQTSPLGCDDCTACLIDHVFGELDGSPGGDAAAVSAHLAQCSACALEFCRLRADLSGLADAVAQAPQPYVAARLRERVQAEFAPPWWRAALASLRRPIPAYGALAAAALPLAAWAVMHTAESSSPQSHKADAATRPVLIEQYDASTVLRVDPTIL